MNCQDLLDRLVDLRDGALPDGPRAEAERHLAACAACAATKRRVDAVVVALGDLAMPAPGGLAERVLQRVPRVPPRVGGGARDGGTSWRDLRRVAGWGLVMAGLAWQLGGGALAARAMSTAAPVVAEARQAVARSRHGGLMDDVGRAGAGVTELARGVRSAYGLFNAPADAAAPQEPRR